MRLSLNWLSQFVDLNGLSEEMIIEKIISAGFEVEEVIRLGSGTNLVVGEVLTCEDYPDSDHLKVTKTNIGDRVLNIVCGAKNCRQGLRVIVAQEGSVLPSGTIRKSEKRGILSEGMLCSLLELGIDKDLLDHTSTSHQGIEELPNDFLPGEGDILSRLGYEDTILDLSIYANRPDCLAMFSLAKEMAAILDRTCTLPDYEGNAGIGSTTKMQVSLRTASCPHYRAKVIGKLRLKESPLWMKAHLRSQGIACMNNVVDISNYVMLETGQPLHFFDLRSNPTQKIEVVDSYEGKYLALDGNSYAMQKGDIMIMSDGKPLAIAGIMGGDISKIKEDTTSILIESALFDRAQIRRTANRIGLQTEAAMRYAKGLDPLAQNKAMDRAVELLIDLADAADIEETVVAGCENYKAHTVCETLGHLNSLIGKEYTMDEVVDVLRRLDFKPVVEGESVCCTIPSYRSEDILLPEDLDEEIVRLTDFDDLKATLPDLPTTVGRLSPLQKLRRELRDSFLHRGFYETVSYTLTDEKGISHGLLALGEPIMLSSPLSDARKYIRTSLLSSMLTTLSYNLNHGNENVNLFEISRVYAKESSQERLAILMKGELSSSRIRHEKIVADFYVLKGILLDLFTRLGYAEVRIKVERNQEDTLHLHPYRSAVLKIDGELIAVFGELHPNYAAEKKLGSVLYAEVLLEKILERKPGKVKVSGLNRYPSVVRDISIVVPVSVTAEELTKAAEKAAGSLVSNVEIFDIYEGASIGEGQKSVSLSLTFESRDHTLRNEEITPVYDKVVCELNKLYNASLRS